MFKISTLPQYPKNGPTGAAAEKSDGVHPRHEAAGTAQLPVLIARVLGGELLRLGFHLTLVDPDAWVPGM